MASFLEGRLTGVERERAVSHLANCDACRGEVAEVHALIGSAPNVSRRRWIGAAAGIAAILAFLLLPRVSGDIATDGDAGVTRSQSLPVPDGATAIAVVAPADSGSLSAIGGVLTWRAAGVGATYALTVQDSAGGVMWSKSLTDTTQAVPDAARLVRGSRYFWSVDALLANGRTASTGPHWFTVR